MMTSISDTASSLLVVAAILWIPVTFFLHCLLHELAHAVVVRFYGGTITGITPYPHRLPSGRFVWASVSYTTERDFSDKERGLVAIAPFALSIVWVIGFAVLSQLWSIAFWFCLIEMVAACIDLTTWILGLISSRPFTDGDNAHRASGSGVWPVFLGLWLFAWGIVSLLGWVRLW